MHADKQEHTHTPAQRNFRITLWLQGMVCMKCHNWKYSNIMQCQCVLPRSSVIDDSTIYMYIIWWHVYVAWLCLKVRHASGRGNFVILFLWILWIIMGTFHFLGIQRDCVRLLCRWMPLGYTSSPATRQGWSITWIGIVCSALDCRLSRVLPFPQKLIGTHWNMLATAFSFGASTFSWCSRWKKHRLCIDRMVLLAVCSSGKPMWITEIACSDPNSPERLSAEVG